MAKTMTVFVPCKGISTGASRVKIEVDGVCDDSCKDLTKPLEAKLGGEMTYKDKVSFYEPPQSDSEKLTEDNRGG